MLKRINNILFPVIVTFLYVIFVYFFIAFLWENGLFVSVLGSAKINIGAKFVCDFIGSLLVVIIILSAIVSEKKPMSEVGLTLKSPVIVSILLAIYIGMFLLNGDFTAKGFYAAFYYLVMVAFSEELVFRGYLFTAVDKEFGFWIAAVVSGLLFGVAHAFKPSIVNEYGTSKLIVQILNELLGQGIVASAFFAILYKKSGTLIVPILVHAIMDYSKVF